MRMVVCLGRVLILLVAACLPGLALPDSSRLWSFVRIGDPLPAGLYFGGAVLWYLACGMMARRWLGNYAYLVSLLAASVALSITPLIWYMAQPFPEFSLLLGMWEPEGTRLGILDTLWNRGDLWALPAIIVGAGMLKSSSGKIAAAFNCLLLWLGFICIVVAWRLTGMSLLTAFLWAVIPSVSAGVYFWKLEAVGEDS